MPILKRGLRTVPGTAAAAAGTAAAAAGTAAAGAAGINVFTIFLLFKVFKNNSRSKSSLFLSSMIVVFTTTPSFCGIFISNVCLASGGLLIFNLAKRAADIYIYKL